MKPPFNRRRQFVRSTLAIPALLATPWRRVIADTASTGDITEELFLPPAIRQELFRLYGAHANSVIATDVITLKAPFIAENGATVPMRVLGEKGLVSSLALFVEQNPQPLSTTFTLHRETDLPVAVRVSMAKSSDVYAVALTAAGLVGVKSTVKITIGCGGG